MKEKNEIKREDLKSNIMKNIIFRFDYQGMIDSTDFVKLFNENFKDFFLEYRKNIHNTVDLQLNNIEDISDTLSIPISEIKKQDIHVFKKNSFGSDKLTLIVSIYNTILNIECVNYKNVNEYIEFINNYIELLFKQNQYLSLKRFGLRKIGTSIYTDFKEINVDFEMKYFNFEETVFEHYKLQKNRIEEIIFDQHTGLKVNFIRSLDTGIIFEEENNEEKKAYQVTLDLDAYLDEIALNNNNYKENLKALIPEINNNHLFNIFKHSVTQDFLNKNLN